MSVRHTKTDTEPSQNKIFNEHPAYKEAVSVIEVCFNDINFKYCFLLIMPATGTGKSFLFERRDPDRNVCPFVVKVNLRYSVLSDLCNLDHLLGVRKFGMHYW